MILLVQNINLYNVKLDKIISNAINFTTFGNYKIQKFTNNPDGITDVDFKITKNGVSAEDEFWEKFPNLKKDKPNVFPRDCETYSTTYYKTFNTDLNDILKTAKKNETQFYVVCAPINADIVAKFISNFGKKNVFVMNLIRNPLVLTQIEQYVNDDKNDPERAYEDILTPANRMINHAMSLKKAGYNYIKFEDMCAGKQFKIGDKIVDFSEIINLDNNSFSSFDKVNSFVHKQEIPLIEDYFKNVFDEKEKKFINVMRELGYEK